MSQRHVTTGFIDRLRRIEERLRNLESSKSTAVKQNDIRLSDTLVRADSPNDRLCLENLVTKQIVCIGEGSEAGDPTQAQWSFSGNLTSATDGTVSPPYLVERATTARQILLAQPCGQSYGAEASVIMCVNFCTADGGDYDQRIVLTGGQSYNYYDVNIPLAENDIIQVTLIDSPTSPVANDISVFVRFGTPSVGVSSNTCAV